MRSQWIRRLIPALIVSAVLAFSYVTSVPAFFNGGAVGVRQTTPDDFGYGNNCGRFGYGTHDHGKLCPHPHPPGQTREGGRASRF